MFDLVDALRGVSGLKQTLLCGWDDSFGAPPVIPGVDLKLVPVARKNIHETGIRAVCQFLWRGARALRALDGSSYDIVHFHFSIPTGLLSAFCMKKPFVCSLHGIDVPGFVNERALLQRLLAPANNAVLSAAQAVFVPNERMAQMVWERCRRAKVELIPHGVNVDAFTPKNSYPRCARRFVTIARLAPWKRIPLLVRAIVELHKANGEVTLDIFGDGEQRAETEALIKAEDAAKYIFLHGYTSKANLHRQLHTYDAFALPSVSEAFGLVFIEAMAAGLPVIGFNYGGPAEIITSDCDGILVEQDSVDAVLAAISRLATTPGLAETLGRNARRTAVDRFSWDRIAARYLAAYEKAASAGR